MLLSNESSAPPGPSHIHFQQYANNPRHIKSHSYPTRKSGNTKSFEEARKKGLCYRCGNSWIRGHRCPKGTIKNFYRDRLKKGKSHVHIVADLVRDLEEYADGHTSDSANDDAVQTNAVDDVKLYDSLLEANDSNIIEGVESEMISDHLAAAISAEDVNHSHFQMSDMA